MRGVEAQRTTSGLSSAVSGQATSTNAPIWYQQEAGEEKVEAGNRGGMSRGRNRAKGHARSRVRRPLSIPAPRGSLPAWPASACLPGRCKSSSRRPPRGPWKESSRSRRAAEGQREKERAEREEDKVGGKEAPDRIDRGSGFGAPGRKAARQRGPHDAARFALP